MRNYMICLVVISTLLVLALPNYSYSAGYSDAIDTVRDEIIADFMQSLSLPAGWQSVDSSLGTLSGFSSYSGLISLPDLSLGQSIFMTDVSDLQVVVTDQNSPLTLKSFGMYGISESPTVNLALRNLTEAEAEMQPLQMIGGKPAAGLWLSPTKRDDSSHIYRDALYTLLYGMCNPICDGGYPDTLSNTNYSMVQVKRQKAIKYTKAYLQQLGIFVENPVSSERAVILPNYYFEYLALGNDAVSEQSARLAWVLKFDNPGLVVWVDAESGTILGGDILDDAAQTAVNPAPAFRTIRVIYVEQNGLSGLRQQSKGYILANSLKEKLINELLVMPQVAPYDVPCSIQLIMAGQERIFRFGYSRENHRLVLLDVMYNRTKFTCNIAWETTAKFDELLQ